MTPVARLREALVTALGGDAERYASLQSTNPDPRIDEGFDAALRCWQSGRGLVADGVAGPLCQQLLGLAECAELEIATGVERVARLFPGTRPGAIARYLPYVEAALAASGLTDRPMVICALATIRAESAGFEPISERASRFNTAPGGAPFALYDNRRGLGNDRPGDGARFRGRGFIQLTGRANYRQYGRRLGIDLQELPDLANAPEIAALLLAQFLRDRATALRAALDAGRLAAARRLVNGGSHGLAAFEDAFDRAASVWPQAASAPPASAASQTLQVPRTPQEPRQAQGQARQGLPPGRASPRRGGRAVRDAPDLRDRVFQPAPDNLPHAWPPRPDLRRYLARYTGAGLVLDQGEEGACCGHALACVINYLRWRQAGQPARLPGASAAMLYTMARRHDEFQGERYEGSTCRGALKGWYRHGVCLEEDWPRSPSLSPSRPARHAGERAGRPRYGFAGTAAGITLGVYYRVDVRSLTDLQAAIARHHALFVSAFTHDGWQTAGDAATGAQAPPDDPALLPVIEFDGRPSRDDGHAFALVGYDTRGFIVQNSWGAGWGAGGFALLAYEDWLVNAMDAWVVALGVPGIVAGQPAAPKPAGQVTPVRAGQTPDAVPAQNRSPASTQHHAILLADDGRVRHHLTEDEAPRNLQQQAFVLPDAWFRRQPPGPRRLVLYCHGGLNDEKQALRRAATMARHFLDNGCYPLFLVWKSGLMETLESLLQRPRLAPGDRGLLDALTEAGDRAIETLVARPLARPLWCEMKENARRALSPGRGGDLLLDAIEALARAWGGEFELHLAGHSAGALVIGHLLAGLRQRGSGECLQAVASIHLLAPACTFEFAMAHFGNDARLMERLHLYLLSDRRERADHVGGVYRKSLLYLVSRALETDRHTRLLGLARDHATPVPARSARRGGPVDRRRRRRDDENLSEQTTTRIDVDGMASAWTEVATNARLWQRTSVNDADTVTVARGEPWNGQGGHAENDGGEDAGGHGIEGKGRDIRRASGHGSFDNDVDLFARMLSIMTGGILPAPPQDLRN